jgi:hypothetical protein
MLGFLYSETNTVSFPIISILQSDAKIESWSKKNKGALL